MNLARSSSGRSASSHDSARPMCFLQPTATPDDSPPAWPYPHALIARFHPALRAMFSWSLVPSLGTRVSCRAIASAAEDSRISAAPPHALGLAVSMAHHPLSRWLLSLRLTVASSAIDSTAVKVLTLRESFLFCRLDFFLLGFPSSCSSTVASSGSPMVFSWLIISSKQSLTGASRSVGQRSSCSWRALCSGTPSL